jgi:hypothetical protein
MKMIGVKRVANFAGASNPIRALLPDQRRDSAVALKSPTG